MKKQMLIDFADFAINNSERFGIKTKSGINYLVIQSFLNEHPQYAPLMQEEPMQLLTCEPPKFEYKTWICTKDKNNPDLNNDYGIKGWELINVVSIGESVRFFFKRQIK